MKTLIIISFFLISLSSFSQRNYIQGIVFSTDSIPLSFVHVYSQATKRGTITDKDGRFFLFLTSYRKTDSIVFSSIGYKKKIVALPEMKGRQKIYLDSLFYSIGGAVIIAKPLLAIEIVEKAFDKVPENFNLESRKSTAYFSEKIEQLLNYDELVSRKIEAALVIDEPSYKKSHSPLFLKEDACLLAIRKGEDTLFHAKLNLSDFNGLTETLTKNIARYPNGFPFNSQKKMQDRWDFVKESIFIIDSASFIYKIKFTPKDTNTSNNYGYFYISSDNYGILQYEVYSDTGVYNQYTYIRDQAQYENFSPIRLIVKYQPTPNGLQLFSIDFFEKYEVLDNQLHEMYFFKYDYKLRIIGDFLESEFDQPCIELKNSKDIHRQADNSDPSFWETFNIPKE